MFPPTKTRILLLVAAVGVLATGACQAPTPTPPAAPAAPDYAAELKPLFDTYIEAWNAQNYDQLGSVFAEDFRRVAPDQNANSRDELIDFMRQAHAAYPDFHIVIGESAYLEDLSFNQWTVTGTATGEDGIQVPVEVNGLTMMRYADGMITEERVYFDSAQLTSQLGNMPHAE